MELTLHLERALLALLLFAGLAVWAIRAYGTSLPPLPPARRAALLGLRLAASLLLCLMLGGLSATLEREVEERPRLRILVDASASMARPAAAGDSTTRYARAVALAEEAGERWGDRLDVEVSAFGLGLLAGPPPAEPAEPGTDVAAALDDLPVPRAGESLLLLSDGRDTEGALWARSLAPGRPVHAVLLGDTLPPPDLRIERVDALPVLHRGASLPLGVELSSQGGAARAGSLSVREGDELLASVPWSLPDGATSTTVEIPLVFDEAGEHLVELRVGGEGPDEAPENDRRLFGVRVIEGSLRILVLAGRPDWDLAALMRGLRGEETLELDVVAAGPDGELRRPADGSPWAPEAEEYQGLLLHSVHRRWPGDLLERLRVRGGVMLMAPFLEDRGGQRLPAAWNLTPPLRRPPTVAEPLLAWGEGASRHPALQGAVALGLSPADQSPLETAFPGPLRRGRALLATRDGVPVLVARELGGERLACFSGKGLWRWSLRSGDGGLLAEEIHSGLLRWLAREDPPGRLVLSWEGEGLGAGRPGELSAELFDEDFRPLAGGQLSWSLRRQGELLVAGEFEAADDGAGEYRATLPALPAGVYELEANAATPSGETLSAARELPVLPPDREHLRPAASAEIPRWLAARSGGVFLAGGGLDALAPALDFTPRRRVSTRQLRLWQHPLAFVLLLGLLAAEWGLRKRFGMV